MSKRQFKSSASAARAFGTASPAAFGSAAPSGVSFGTSSSPLSYLHEQPDLSTISDSHVVVAFKNLSKRDATTKTKALEDLQALLVESGKDIEDGVLDAWTYVYPRTSIDTGRRVRQLSHALMGHVASKSGKRIARRMPVVIGAWLAGTYDNDKAVARAANEALASVFTSAEKRRSLWKAYQEPLLEFSRNVFDKETAQTLSDERSISPDEASAKYFRVVTSAVGLLSGLLSDVQNEEFQKHETQYTEVLQDKRLWEKAVSEDVGLRKSIHKLLRNLLQTPQTRPCLDLGILSNIYITKGMDSDQTGSAGDYIETVLALTTTDSTIWTNRWKDKKQPSSRLKALVKRGTQGGALTYWTTIVKLFNAIPADALPSEQEKAQEIMKNFHGGVTRKEEPRPHQVEGLKAYVQTAGFLSVHLPQDLQNDFLRDTVRPLISQYISPKSENVKWNVPTNAAPLILQEINKNDKLVTMLLSEFPTLAAELVREIKLSLPESAKEYTRSQDDLTKTGERFAGLVAVLNASSEEPSKLEQPVAEVLSEAIAVVSNRNGKPYGAAAVVAAMVNQAKELLEKSEALKSIVSNFLQHKIATVYASPSYKQLASILSAYEDQKEIFDPAWRASLDATLTTKSDKQYEMLTELLTCRTTVTEDELDTLGPLLAPHVLTKVDEIWTAEGRWDPILTLFTRSPITSQLFAAPVLERITASLVHDHASAIVALDGLRHISRTAPTTLKEFLSTEHGQKVLPNLLLLSESPDEQLHRDAQDLIPVMQGLLGGQLTNGASGNAVLDVIQAGLSAAGPSSVSISTLVNHAKGLLGNKMVESVETLLPNLTTWSETLQPFLRKAVDKSLSVTSAFSGAVFLTTAGEGATEKIERDGEGFSVPLRMGMYTVRLFASATSTDTERNPSLVRLLTLTTSLANDHLSIANSSNLWSLNEPDLISEVSDFVSSAQQLLKSWHEAGDRLTKLKGTHSSEAYYLALADAKLESERQEVQGGSAMSAEELEEQLKTRRKEGHVFNIVAELYAHQNSLQDSAVVMRYCNEIVADLTGFDAEKLQAEGLPQLVVLKTILSYYEDAGETIAKVRLTKFMAKAVGWLLDEAIEDELVAELYRMMAHLLPLLHELYGDYWKNILDSIKSNLELVSELPDENAPALIPSLHAALRLFGVIRKIKSTESVQAEDEQNDDVLEAWIEYEPLVNAAMIKSLKVSRMVADEAHQPLMIFNELLSREISRIPTSKLAEAEELFSQLYSMSPAVQQAAYRLLHRYIPSRQEQISVDVVLEKRQARLPDELLSLILETPVAADLHEEDFERNTPLQLRGYMLSWLLVFDHFTNASHKAKGDYVESMKEAGHITDFLDFTFDFLGHGKGRPLDVSKFDVASYNSAAMEDSPLKDTQWLLTHLYYLCLTHFPALTKTWWIDCKARQKVISVESWTAKFIAPLVISTALEEVAKWADTQEIAHTSEEPPPLAIKINHRASDLTAAYLIDDEGQSASITISLPSTFPLHNARVHSSSKAMAVDERRWNAWLLNSQAIIAFSNNSIIDGLLAWRRNVFGALKGQTECAICYSVVGEDGRVPGKKCRTCKNAFHGGCLYKWFRSSNATTCPLCRESFNYG